MEDEITSPEWWDRDRATRRQDEDQQQDAHLYEEGSNRSALTDSGRTPDDEHAAPESANPPGMAPTSAVTRAPNPKKASRQGQELPETISSAALASLNPYEYAVSNPSLTPFYPSNPKHQLPPPQDPLPSRNHSGAPTILLQDARSRVATYMSTAPKKLITDPYFYHLGISAHRMLYETAGEEEALFSNYKKRTSNFFRVGRVFLTLWVEPTGDSTTTINSVVINDRIDPALQSSRPEDLVYSRVRRFVVVREGKEFCSALPIVSYGRAGVSRAGVKKNHHAIIYTSLNAPQPKRGEVSAKDELPMQPLAIRVVPDERGAKLDEMSRIDFGKIHSIHCRVKVAPFGQIHLDSMDDLLRGLSAVWPTLPRTWPEASRYSPTPETGMGSRTASRVELQDSHADLPSSVPPATEDRRGQEGAVQITTTPAASRENSLSTFASVQHLRPRDEWPNKGQQPSVKPFVSLKGLNSYSTDRTAVRSSHRIRPERCVSDLVSRKEVEEYFWRRLPEAGGESRIQLKERRWPSRRRPASTNIRARIDQTDAPRAQSHCSDPITASGSECHSSDLLGPARQSYGILTGANREPSALSASMSTDSTLPVHTFGRTRSEGKPMDADLARLVMLCSELIQADDAIRASHFSQNHLTPIAPPTSSMIETMARQRDKQSFIASQQARAENALQRIRESLDTLRPSPRNSMQEAISSPQPPPDAVGFGVPGDTLSMTPDQRFLRYQHRLGDVNIFRERLREIEIMYAEESAIREMKRDRDDPLNLTDQEFGFEYETQRTKARKELDAAEADLAVIEAQCLADGIELRQQKTVSSSVLSASGDGAEELEPWPVYEVETPASVVAYDDPVGAMMRSGSPQQPVKAWLDAFSPDPTPIEDASSSILSVARRAIDDRLKRFLLGGELDDTSQDSTDDASDEDKDLSSTEDTSSNESAEGTSQLNSTIPALMYHRKATA